MNVLVIGGTRFIGIHLVNKLLSEGNKVTIATRGQTSDTFGESVNRLIIERTDSESISSALNGKHFDVVYDSLAYCSNDIKCLFDSLSCNRYIQTSSLSVYSNLKNQICESDFNPETYPLKWCFRNDYTYDEIKRQAECALFQQYHIPSVSVRFPYVIGTDDYTNRLYFYVECVMKSIPMYVDNLTEKMAFINSNEAGDFLAFLAKSNFQGSINAASYGTISLAEIIDFIEIKTGVKAVFSNDGKKAPYNGATEYSLNLRKSEEIGYKFSHINTWIYDLLDFYYDSIF